MCQLWFKFKSAKLKMAVIRRGICLQFIKKGFYVRLRMFSFIKLMFALLWCCFCFFFSVPYIYKIIIKEGLFFNELFKLYLKQITFL